MSSKSRLYTKKLKAFFRKLGFRFKKYWKKNAWNKTKIIVLAIFILVIGSMYGIARWYIYTQESTPTQLGVSFVPDYAESLGLNPIQTFSALVNGLHIKYFRLTSYWSDIEPTKGQYDFSELDQEFALADKANAHVMLVVGLRQPGYPECHPPNWVNTSQPTNSWQPALEQYMTSVVNRYKNNPALMSYQLENEYFLKGFGTCQNFSRQRLVDEDNLLKALDPNHPIIIGRSNNDVGWPIGAPLPKQFSVSIYQRVWDANVTHRYLEYPFPAWYYAFMAGWQKIFTGRNMIIGELQAEPWAPNDKTIPEISLAEQNKSFNPNRLKNTIEFGKATGMKTIYLWGAEYWYYRKVVLHDPSVWNTAKQEFQSN